MICCNECFRDSEIRAEIEMIGRIGTCPVCGGTDVWIYDSEQDADSSNVSVLLESVLQLYVPETELPDNYPEAEKLYIEDALERDWKLFAIPSSLIRRIVCDLVNESYDLGTNLLFEKVGVPQLFDETYLQEHSICGIYGWDEFKRILRNENRFHSRCINTDLLSQFLKDAEIRVKSGETFYRARLTNERGENGFSRKEMGAPPADIAASGRANSKGQSCLYLSSNKKTTLKEVRAHAFDYVTIATFKPIRDLRILDLSSITHNTPFYEGNNLLSFLINEPQLRRMEIDMAKPMSRWDSDLDYLPTQYISDFAKYIGFDGVKYYSTFDKSAYNIALFDGTTCKCVYSKTYYVEEMNHTATPVSSR